MLYYNDISEKYVISDIKSINFKDVTLSEAKIALRYVYALTNRSCKYMPICRCSYSELAIGDYYTIINSINSDRIYLKSKHNDYVLYNYIKQSNNIYKNCYKPSDDQLVKYIYLNNHFKFCKRQLIY